MSLPCDGFMLILEGVSKNKGTPKSSILIGFSIIFTIHFGGFHPPIFGSTPILEGVDPDCKVDWGQEEARGVAGLGNFFFGAAKSPIKTAQQISKRDSAVFWDLLRVPNV